MVSPFLYTNEYVDCQGQFGYFLPAVNYIMVCLVLRSENEVSVSRCESYGKFGPLPLNREP